MAGKLLGEAQIISTASTLQNIGVACVKLPQLRQMEVSGGMIEVW